MYKKIYGDLLAKPPIPRHIFVLMVNKELLKRVRYVVGHLQGIEKMISEERDPLDIYTQLLSVRSALKRSVLDTLENQTRYELAESIVKALDTCDGKCERHATLAKFKQDFPTMTNKEVLASLKVLHSQQKTNL